MRKITTFLNPFAFLVGNERPRPLKYARVLYSSLKIKLLDAIYIASGYSLHQWLSEKPSIYPQDSRPIYLCDLFTLGIPFLLLKFAFKCIDSVRVRVVNDIVAVIIYLLVIIPMAITRCLISCVIMLLALPFILITHAVTRLMYQKEQQNMNQPVSIGQISMEWGEIWGFCKLGAVVERISFDEKTLIVQLGIKAKEVDYRETKTFKTPVTFETYAYFDKIPSLLKLYSEAVSGDQARSLMRAVSTSKMLLRVLGKHPKIPTDVMGHILSYAFPLARVKNNRVEEVDDLVNEALYNARLNLTSP